ncbi:hypothetical protein GCM10010862_03450 [Devosia nitrariae]|uniref:Uncharacterized protein n=1 Tax=Devosia nitrariae TaxID=2071872 RepID=A0ABQ5VZ29_9HYPH|nr:hypothetical protein GCM10010862_03450 [Devosia nitrariae]
MPAFSGSGIETSMLDVPLTLEIASADMLTPMAVGLFSASVTTQVCAVPFPIAKGPPASGTS